MNKPIKIYIHTPSWSLARNNTDLKLRAVLKSMEEKYPGVIFYIPLSFWAGAEHNIKFVINRLLGVLYKCFRIRGSYFSSDTNLYAAEVRKFNPDIILSQGSFPKNNKTNIPVIWETFFVDPVAFIGKQDVSWNQFLKKFEKYSTKAAAIGVRDYYSIDQIKQKYPECKEKVAFLPFYLPGILPLEKQMITNKHIEIKSPVRLLFVGREAKRKGLDTLIEAVRFITDSHPELSFELTVVSAMSDGKIDIPLHLPVKYYKSLPHDKVLELFKASHVYVMTSRRESFGLTYLEGMANGCAVVARDFQPQRDIFDYGESGLLVAPENSSALANILMNLIRDSNLRLHYALKGYEKFLKQYYYPKVADFWINTFQKCV